MHYVTDIAICFNPVTTLFGSSGVARLHKLAAPDCFIRIFDCSIRVYRPFSIQLEGKVYAKVGWAHARPDPPLATPLFGSIIFCSQCTFLNILIKLIWCSLVFVYSYVYVAVDIH